MNDRVAVSILTNGTRRPYLQRCVESLLHHCVYRPLLIGIHDNGSRDDTFDWLTALPEVHGVEWRVSHARIDMGCAIGTNMSIALVEDCELQLHLESDFELLSPEESGFRDDWMFRAVELFRSGECDYLYLRRMRNEAEARMHWWSQWMPKIDMEKSEFLRCPGFWWSNNPSLFRLEAMMRDHVLPLDESKDGPKGTAGWSQPEMQAARPSKTWLHKWGLFIHDRQPGEVLSGAGCGRHGPYGVSTCKYGYWKDGLDGWCQACDPDKGPRDMQEHDARARAGVSVKLEEPVNPKVSVILPTYNRKDMLRRAVESMLAQEFRDFELVVVIDGSTDGSAESLKTIRDGRLRVHVQENKKLPGALNTGHGLARGEYLTWVSDDCWFDPEWLGSLVAGLDAAPPSVGMVFSDIVIHRPDGSSFTAPTYDSSIRRENNVLASFMYRRKAMEDVGTYDELMLGAEDWDYWNRMATKFLLLRVDGPPRYHYMTHAGTMSETIPDKVRESTAKVRDRHAGTKTMRDVVAESRIFMFVSNPDTNEPHGGIRQIYRHVDVLNRLGFDAYVLHCTKGFRCTWFRNDTKVACVGDVSLGPRDYVVVPEIGRMPEVAGNGRCGHVVFAQGPHLVFRDHMHELRALRDRYNALDGVLVVSEYARRNLSQFFPGATVQRIQLSFGSPFSLCTEKKRQVCYMTRKRPDDVKYVLAMLEAFGPKEEGWTFKAIEGMSEEQVAEVMMESAIFLSFGWREGYHCPPAEAMMCGCVVVGFHGLSCYELFDGDHAYEIEDSDVQSYVLKVSELMAFPFEDLVEKGRQAHEHVARLCSEDAEMYSVWNAWRTITGRRAPESKGRRVKAVVLHHGMPEKADALMSKLDQAFDSVELIDCGSPEGKVPRRVTLRLPNVYWQGAWLEAMKRWGDYDVVWVIGADVELREEPAVYRRVLDGLPRFGCWSPAIDGRAHPFMQAEHYAGGKLSQVKNIEGMALAVSGELIRIVGARFAVDTKYGFGHDYWLCAMARQAGLPNYIGGAVVFHPPGVGYNEGEAHELFDKAFSDKYGGNFRHTLFEYRNTYEGNLCKEEPQVADKQLKLVCVDNGWGIKEFERITGSLSVRRVVMRKGVSDFSADTKAEVIPYDEKLTQLLDADMAFFARVGAANRREFEALVDAGVPTVVHADYQNGKVEHEKTGYVYQHESWGRGWLNNLINDASLRKRLSDACRKAPQGAMPQPTPAAPQPEPPPAPVAEQKVEVLPNKVRATIITPTYRRDPRVVSRCIDCVRLQTEKSHEHLVCSDGSDEKPIAALVASIKDPRITYSFTQVKKPGDFGNVVRAEMMKRATGEYVMFLDDDNLILPHYLETMIAAVEKAKADFAVCRIVHFGPLREDAVGAPPQVLTGLPVKLHYIDSLQVLVRRTAMLEVGWDTEKGYLADGHSLQRLGEKFKFVEVPEVLGFHM